MREDIKRLPMPSRWWSFRIDMRYGFGCRQKPEVLGHTVVGLPEKGGPGLVHKFEIERPMLQDAGDREACYSDRFPESGIKYPFKVKVVVYESFGIGIPKLLCIGPKWKCREWTLDIYTKCISCKHESDAKEDFHTTAPVLYRLKAGDQSKPLAGVLALSVTAVGLVAALASQEYALSVAFLWVVGLSNAIAVLSLASSITLRIINRTKHKVDFV